MQPVVGRGAGLRAGDAGRERDKAKRIARVVRHGDGQVLDLARGDDGADLGALRLNGRAGGGHSHRLLNRRRAKNQILRSGRADGNANVLLNQCAKASDRSCKGIEPRG